MIPLRRLLTGLVVTAGILALPDMAAAQAYPLSGPVPEAADSSYGAEASARGWIYVGPKGSFHLDTARIQNQDHPGSRGIFKTVSWHGTRYWSNSFTKIRIADPHFWHYRMMGYHYQVALAKHPSCCQRYAVWVKNPRDGPDWHLYQYATRGKARGNGL